jgi:5-formyltetrahydrofolate cyclo-ligase
MSYPSSVHDAKARLREEMRGRRAALDEQARAAAADAIARRAILIISALKFDAIGGYFAVRGEADPRPILAWAERTGITCALPSVHGGYDLVFRRYRSGDPLHAGSFGIPSPAHDAPAITPDLLIVPLMAFDRTGARLGYGRGFYDRTIAHLRNHGVDVRLVGIAFAVQEVDAVPTEAHDARMDFIVTEKETIDLTVGKAKG